MNKQMANIGHHLSELDMKAIKGGDLFGFEWGCLMPGAPCGGGGCTDPPPVCCGGLFCTGSNGYNPVPGFCEGD